jgi:hypothetical protein
MRITHVIAITLAVSGPALAQGTETQKGPLGATAPLPPGANAAAPGISERAETLVKQMGAYIGSAQQFTFHADILFDHVLPSGQKLQFAAAQEVALERPGRLYIEYRSDLGNRKFWYDGKSVTLFDPATPFYAAEPAPPEIDSMLEKVVAELDFSPPLVDFLYHDPYGRVRGNVQYALDLGMADVNGMSCHNLGFVAKNVDWQIWIEDGPQWTPCKVVITYKTLPAQPQLSAVFTQWNFAPRIAEPVFTPELPPGTEKIAFQKVGPTASPK